MNGSSDTALVIAGISLGISVTTFIWRILYDLYVDAPRLKVTLQAMAMFGGEQINIYVVTATNRGRRPTTITSMWLCFGRPRRRWMRLLKLFLSKERRERFLAGGIILPDELGMAYNTKLPKRLDSGEQASVYYSQDTVHARLRETPYRLMYGTAGATLGGSSSKAMRLTPDMYTVKSEQDGG